jgi:hypothetical protein
MTGRAWEWKEGTLVRLGARMVLGVFIMSGCEMRYLPVG